MLKIGLVEVLDSLLQDEKRVPEDESKKIMKAVMCSLLSLGYDVTLISMIDIIKKNMPSYPYLQVSITEGIEESASAGKVQYRSPVTSLKLWLKQNDRSCKHRANVTLVYYDSYDANSVLDLVANLVSVVSQYLKK